jgi:DNA-binding NtrC family response regulator
MIACPPHDPERDVPEDARRTAVLIVEDERVARRALCLLLAAHGFNAIATESAEEALQVLERLRAQAQPRVALVDFNLPGMNGLDFISQLERMDPSAFPVLMTASSEETVGEAVRDRHLMYLRKPLDLGELLTVITHGDERPSLQP